MAIGTVAGTVYTPPTKTSVTDNILSGFKAPLLSDDEVLDSSGAFWASVVWGGIGSVIGGVVTRKRAASGKEPIVGFLY